MAQISAFLAWSKRVRGPDAVEKALVCVKRQLTQRGYAAYDWTENQSTENIRIKIGEQITRSDLVILEGSDGLTPNLGYEVGFAHALYRPLIIIRQGGSGDLPADFGAPEFLEYPSDVTDEAAFQEFEDRFCRLLEHLENTQLTPGRRSVMHSVTTISEGIQRFLSSYPVEHPTLHLMSGWVDALAREVETGGSSHFITDADYYMASFSHLREWQDGQVVAIADLTDGTEPFWTPDHPEEMSANVSERIFLADWKWFFEDEIELSRRISLWRRHKVRHRDRKYEIYIATKEESQDGEVHPLGPNAVGHHLLLIDPDVVGGYRHKGGRSGGRQLVVERDALQHATAKQFYDAVKQRAVRFDPNSRVPDLRRELLAKTGIGRWDLDWTNETEYRSSDYFELYDRNIRCWIPLYQQMIGDCASHVAREILRIYARQARPVDLLELGYGTGNLTRLLLPWIESTNKPFFDLDHQGPVARYRAIDRAEQMTKQARELLKPERYSHFDLRLVRGTAWEGIQPHRYDVIFGSLVMHFLIGPDPTEETLDRFIENCAEFSGDDASLVFADVFGADTDASTRQMMDNWRNWMVSHGMSAQDADIYLQGNSDMTRAASPKRLGAAARAHGFQCTVHSVGRRDLPFRIVILRRYPRAASAK